jgi:hypothetical protein
VIPLLSGWLIDWSHTYTHTYRVYGCFGWQGDFLGVPRYGVYGCLGWSKDLLVCPAILAMSHYSLPITGPCGGLSSGASLTANIIPLLVQSRGCSFLCLHALRVCMHWCVCMHGCLHLLYKNTPPKLAGSVGVWVFGSARHGLQDCGLGGALNTHPPDAAWCEREVLDRSLCQQPCCRVLYS